MTPPWANLNNDDRALFGVVTTFLEKRLSEVNTVNWAVNLKLEQRVERLAVLDCLDSEEGLALKEPWASAWRFIEESWSFEAADEETTLKLYDIGRRLKAGERSGAIVAVIVNLVAPQLTVEPISSFQRQFRKMPRRPRLVDDLVSASLTSGKLVDLGVLNLDTIEEVEFLVALATCIDSSVSRGLDIARRLGWDGERTSWQLGDLHRCYYVDSRSEMDDESEPDAYHRGIAPAVKLLHSVVERIAEIDCSLAMRFVERWRVTHTPVHVRLWAAMARSTELVSKDGVESFLLALADRVFWDLDHFPEIAELRSVRFGQLDADAKSAIARRLRKGPPRSYWRRRARADLTSRYRLLFSLRELNRIVLSGGDLPSDLRSWLDAQVGSFVELRDMRVDSGFPESVSAHRVPPNPDNHYSAIDGFERLRALEKALSSDRASWDDDPSGRAIDWIQSGENALLVFSDLESTHGAGDEVPRVWDRFGWAHTPNLFGGDDASSEDCRETADRVLVLLEQLSDKTLKDAIGGICAWMDMWGRTIVSSNHFAGVWLRLWPIAVNYTNEEKSAFDEASNGGREKPVGSERDVIDILNPPTGKLVGVFLKACPNLSIVEEPFGEGSTLERLRNALIESAGRSGIIVRHRLILSFPYFYEADTGWTKKHLIDPLLSSDESALDLWDAIGRRHQPTEILKLIGDAMATRATDRRLRREARSNIVFNLVVESMRAFREGRDPAVSNATVSQMLRKLDDAVRATAANVAQIYVSEMSKDKEGANPSVDAAEAFRSAVVPFLRLVWPQERSLATPGISRAFADLPAASGEAFAEAVEVIERFLRPFECWSMLEYGLYNKSDDEKAPISAAINNEVKAGAFLKLLDLTVGTAQDDVIPYGLTVALDRIEEIAPNLAESTAFRRLSTAARR